MMILLAFGLGMFLAMVGLGSALAFGMQPPASHAAFAEGLRDGVECARYRHELSMGMTFPSEQENEAYDRGANMGELIGRILPRKR